ncbi:MAG: WD40/YVTN/BNR-like repeat-containing protein [Opitutales bacterium]
MRLSTLSVCLIAASTVFGAVEPFAARYGSPYGNRTMPDSVAIAGTDQPEVHRSLADRPQAYRFAVQPGKVLVRVSYLDAAEANNGAFVERIDGETLIPVTACLAKPPKQGGTEAVVRTVVCEFQTTSELIELRFDRTSWGTGYAISALEVADASGLRYNIDCGGKGPSANWQIVDRYEAPGVAAPGALPIQTGAWVDLSETVLDALETNGIYPTPKWDGHYTRKFNSLVVDHGANTYLNFAGHGLWTLDFDTNTLHRADAGAYTEAPLDNQINPYGSGFFLFSSHGFTPESYQLRSLDGTPETFANFPGNFDYGAVDWTRSPLRTIIAVDHHRRKLWVSTDGGEEFSAVLDAPPYQLGQVGALPGGTLIHCLMGNRQGEVLPNTGVYRSTNDGRSWEKVSEPQTPHACFDIPVYQDRAYLYTVDGLAISEDDGQTWRVVPNSPRFEHPVVFGADDSQMLGFNREGGFASTDRGETWNAFLPPPPVADRYIQDHRCYDFAWGHQRGIVYAYAPDKLLAYRLP